MALSSGRVGDVDVTAVAVVLAAGADGPRFDDDARQAGDDLGVHLDALIESESLRGDAGSVLAVPLAASLNAAPETVTPKGVPSDGALTGSRAAAGDAKAAAGESPRRLYVVGVGAGEPGDWRAAGAALARRSGSVGRLALVPGSVLSPIGLRSLAEGLALGGYRVAGLLDRVASPGEAPGEGVASSSRLEGGASTGNGVPTVSDESPVEDARCVAGKPPGAGALCAGDAPSGEGAPLSQGSSIAGGGGLREVVVLDDGLADDPEARAALRAARTVGISVCIARDLVNTPSLLKSPQWLAERAVRIATAAGLTAQVLEPAELAERGFGGLCAVGRGSPRPPRLVRIEYFGPTASSRPGEAVESPSDADPATLDPAKTGSSVAQPHRVLVGKGITFDSGGLSLKPPGSMISMKTDMAGAAAVLGAMTALPSLGVPGRVTGLLCLAENMIGAAAMRPGDVITCWGGTTVEVLNTDAEGRLVLADALAYAAGELGADVLVDLATLTGAISVALGRRTAGLFSSDDDLAAALAAAADSAGERVWRLPLTAEYRPALDSPVADLTNIGRALDVGGGSITAALFLREFAGGLPWAHLDIAGTARADADDGEISRGGTGWGVRTLLAWLALPPASASAASDDLARV
ncbi:M17 family metallopeptidase [Frankia sp. AiPa1]|uniref:leucyl aminopeptidase family protein n=1 Tax=Frankia sp. AiPa1 TaxID=573492 RepID=UPI00202B6320|nr:M17 family metallopeptidase [Frankia sp. AiPa1]